MSPRIAVLLLVALCGSSFAADPTFGQTRRVTGATTRQIEIGVRDQRGLVPDDLTLSDLEVREANAPRPLLAIEPLTGGESPGTRVPWTVVIFVDAPLSTAAGIRASAEALAKLSGELVELGRVQVVLSEAAPLVLAGPTRDADEVRSALLGLATGVDSAGELLTLRRRALTEIQSEPRAPSRDALVLDAIVAEEELIAWQREALLDWLVTAPLPRPRALLLVEDGFDLAARRLYQGNLGNGSPSFDARLARLGAPSDQQELARTLAAEGWTVLALDLQRPGAPPTELGAAADPLPELAEATGGRVLTDSRTLLTEIRRLRQRLRLTYQAPDDLRGNPYPLEVRARRPDLQVEAPLWASSVTAESVAAARARQLIAGGDQAGELEVVSTLYSAGREQATLVTELDLGFADPVSFASDSLRVTLFLGRLDLPARVFHQAGAGEDLSDAERWRLRVELEVPDDLQEVAVVVEELRSGRWGATLAEVSDGMPGLRSPTTVAETVDLRSSSAPPAPEALHTSAQVIRILPPRRDDLTGRQRFQTIVTSPSVERVAFELDGREVATDDKSPFEARIELGSEMAPHSVRVVAYSRLGDVLGEDSVHLNEPTRPFRASLTQVQRLSGSDAVDVTAELSLPTGAVLDRVELYRNETLGARLTAPPFHARLPGPPGELTDYVRVVVYLEDGSTAEDLRLLDAPGAVEQIEVNLVELYVVVIGPDGKPVRDLTQADFTIMHQGRERPVERFGFADDVPLVLGLVIDTSQSMWTLMPDTKKAAARFLGDTVSSQDRAFVVDFDTRPRLARATTGDLFELLNSLGRLQADGFTAMWDAMIFAILQFEEGRGRKALVVLTDGDDYKSRFGHYRAIQYGLQAGTPIYIIALGGLDDLRRSFRKVDLEAVAGATAGRVYYITSPDQLGDAYAQIAAELRSQYLLAFSSERELSDEELAKIRVRVPGQDFEVRTVVGASPASQ